MSDRLGLSLSAGKTRIPASFHGTMRLVDEHELPAAPSKISGLDILPGEFQTEINITFDLLLKLGFVPVDPAHPAHPSYLDALAAHDQAAPAEQDNHQPVLDSLSPHFIRVPFQTTFLITAEMSLKYGLVPPRRDAGAAQDRNTGRAASGRIAMPPPLPPPGPSATDLPPHVLADPGATPIGGKRDKQFPWAPSQKLFLPDRAGDGGGFLSAAGQDRLPVGPTANSLGLLPTIDFEAFLDFLGAPERRAPSATSGRLAPVHEAAQEALGSSDPSASTTRAAAGITTNAVPTVSGVSLSDSAVAAHEAAANAEERRPSNSARDAIRPVYPVEIGIGIVAAGVAGGVGAAARMVGGVILRQLVPESRPAARGAPAKETATAEKPSGLTASVSKQSSPNASATPAAIEKPPFSRQKQDGHIAGTPQNRNRFKSGKTTSLFDGSAAEADALTQEAWEKGSPVGGESRVREYDFCRRIGTAPDGKGQSIVRVHQDATGRIHGHPYGWK